MKLLNFVGLMPILFLWAWSAYLLAIAILNFITGKNLEGIVFFSVCVFTMVCSMAEHTRWVDLVCSYD